MEKILFQLTFVFLLLPFCSFSESAQIFTDEDLGKYKSQTNQATEPDQGSVSKKSGFRDEIERTYFYQLLDYNTEIGTAKANVKYHDGNFLDYLKAGRLRLSESERQKAEEWKIKERAAIQKRNDLKIKVLEKYGSLPSWWSEK